MLVISLPFQKVFFPSWICALGAWCDSQRAGRQFDNHAFDAADGLNWATIRAAVLDPVGEQSKMLT